MPLHPDVEMCPAFTNLAAWCRYAEACERQGVLPHKSMSMAFAKMKGESGELELVLHQMADVDAVPVIDLLVAAEAGTEVTAVDVTYDNTASTLDGLLLLRLLRAAGSKLRAVDLRENAFGREALRDLFQGGLQSATLDLSFSRIRKMDMTGQFSVLHTLKLDYAFPVTSLPEGCFRGMPNLARLSMCATEISNLWTTCAALTRLPRLVELRFQKCLCCQGTGQCSRVAEVSASCLPEKKAWANQCDTKQSMDWTPTSIVNDYDSLDMEEFSRTEDGESDNIFSDDDSNAQRVNASSVESTVESEADFRAEVSDVDRLLYSAAHGEEALHEDMDCGRDGGLPEGSSSLRPGDNLDHGGIEDEPVGSTSHSVEFDVQGLERMMDVGDYHAGQQQADLDEVSATTSASSRSSDTADEVNRMDFRPVHGNVASSEGGGSSGDEAEGPARRTRRSSSLGLRGVHHASPICLEKYYRQFMVASLKGLKVLDNMSVSEAERQQAQQLFSEQFERMANNRNEHENVVEVLKRREMGGWGCGSTLQQTYRLGASSNNRSKHAYCRSLCAAKMASCAWPATTAICRLKKSNLDVNRRYRPRQFEYHPTESSYMVFGTLHGEVVVVNHESDKVVGYVQSIGAPHSILGLCWLNKDPSKLIAGSDNGSLQLYDVNRMNATMVLAGRSDGRPSGQGRSASSYWSSHNTGSAQRSNRSPTIYTYDDFEQLTSVHINSMDDYFLASGYSKHVGLYDLRTGKRLQIFADLHQEHINVVKFAHHSPHLFATSSFDKDIKMWDIRQKAAKPLYTVQSVRGNVMVCFSRDDHYLLSSAVDNEVRQYLSVDGRLHMKFDISPTGSGQNYTRSYYMNGRDYIITGSCEENVVRICCAQTGRRLRDLALEGRGLKNSLYVQSLRGDPFKDFHFSVLVAYNHPHSRSEIVKVNLLSGDGHQRGSESEPQYASLAGMGA